MHHRYLFLEHCGKVACRMQHAQHFQVLAGRSVEDEIVLKAGDRQHAHTGDVLIQLMP